MVSAVEGRRSHMHSFARLVRVQRWLHRGDEILPACVVQLKAERRKRRKSHWSVWNVTWIEDSPSVVARVRAFERYEKPRRSIVGVCERRVRSIRGDKPLIILHRGY